MPEWREALATVAPSTTDIAPGAGETVAVALM
jgi:hypothetical protein